MVHCRSNWKEENLLGMLQKSFGREISLGDVSGSFLEDAFKLVPRWPTKNFAVHEKLTDNATEAQS